MDLWELVNQFGLPVALLIYFIVDGRSQAKEHRNDLRDVANKAVSAIDRSTEALNDNVKSITDNSAALRDNTNVLNQIKGANPRGMQNDRGNGN